MGTLFCFFCDETFEGIQVLHSHQKECALASNSQKILADAKNSVGKKRSFLSYLNLIPKVNAEHVRSEKRRDVVLDVIVIDDDSDDENKDVTIDKSQRYLLSPSSQDSKAKQNGRLRSKSKNCGLGLDNAFAKTSSKVFKFDISSPLGMRLRYHCKQLGNCRLPISKICRANYELYCGTSTTRTAHSNRCYHVSYRKSRQPLKFCHRYKFTRTQLRESCRAHRSGLSLSSLRLKRRMKPCRISVKKLNLPCDDTSRGTFDAKMYMPLLNLKSDDESLTKVSDEEVAITKTQTVVDAHEPSVLPPNGFLNILNIAGLQGSDSHKLDDDKMRNTLKHPVKRKGAYHTFRLRKPDARCSTVDVFSPVDGSCPGLVGWVNKRCERPQIFNRNVEFVPLTALYEQSVFEVENQDPQTWMFQISSVYSLAKSQDNEKSQTSDLPEELPSSESIVPLPESFPPPKITSPAGSADVITIVDHDNSPQEAGEQTSQATEKQSTFHGLPGGAADVIDLTENVSLSLPGCSEASATVSQPTVVESSNRNTSGVVRDMLHQLSKQLCNPSSDKSQKSTDVHKLPSEKSSGQQVSHLQKELEQPIVIEIPDEDSAVLTKQQRNHATQSHSNNSNNNNNNKASSTSNNNLGNSDRSTTLPSQRLPDKSLHSVPPTWHMVQPTIPARGQNGVQTSDTIDLSFDSDSEALDKETVATGQKRPLLSNPDSCPPRKRDRPGVSLEHSSLPPLTFKCHICGCFFNFDNNSGTMIQNHYRMHNVTNIELVKQLLPNGQTTWSLVELNNVGKSTHSKPPGPAASTALPHTSISPNRVVIDVSSTRPSVTPRCTPSILSSSRSAVRQKSNALPEFVSLEESCFPETLSSNPDVSSAKKRSSPSTTRLNSEKNCSMLPQRHTQPVYASSVADVNAVKIISPTIKDAGSSQAGRQERNDLHLQKQTIDARTLRAIHLARMRPNVPSSTHAFTGSVPRAATASSAGPRQQVYFPTSANVNRMLVDRERGDDGVGNQMQSKHNALASIQSNNNIVHGVICLD